MATFTCALCRETKEIQTDGGTGYARRADDSLICYSCCAVEDKKAMVKTGRAILYLTSIPCAYAQPKQPWNTQLARVSNWPGTLEFKCDAHKVGRHNMAGTRYDVWFTGPDGKNWHGVQYGENTQICHCRRTK